MIKKHGQSLLIILVLAISGLQIGCGIADSIRETNVEIRNAVDTLDRAIESLVRQSADWQVVLEDLEQALAADIQSTLRVEVTNLLRTGVLAAGSEFRCDAEFLRLRTERELRRIRNDLAQEVNNAGFRPPIPLLPIPPPEPHFCSVVPSAIDVSLPPIRRTLLEVYGFDLRSLPITADVIGSNGSRSVSPSIGIASDTQLVLDLTSGGANLDENDRAIIFSWGDSNSVQSVVRVVLPGAPEPSCREEEVPVKGGKWGPFILDKTGTGDADFNGHGPCVRFDLLIGVDHLRNRLIARYSVEAYECHKDKSPQKDFTWAKKEGLIILHQETYPNQILSLVGFADSHRYEYNYEYRDSNHARDIYYEPGIAPVAQLTFVGDTDGDEAGSKTQVEIVLKEMRVKVSRCKP